MHPSDDAGPAIEMPRYRSHKRVWALQIKSLDFVNERGTRLSFEEEGYAPIIAPLEMFSRYQPEPGDYYVVYDDGYKSFSPKKAFQEGYARIDGFTPRRPDPNPAEPRPR